MFEKVAYEKWSGRKLYHWLKFELNFKTIQGNKNLSLSNIYLILQNTFYYGEFEFPRRSGIWYKGQHEPLITKELFNLVQQQVKTNIIRVEDQEFAFTKLMSCGLCGSGVSADEKLKKQKNGNIHRYVYYGCTKSRDKNCKSGYISEEELITQLEKMIDNINLDEVSIKDKIKHEVEKFKKFQSRLLGIKEKINVSDIDIREYIKYILADGADIEKRELLSCMKNKLALANKKIFLN